MNRALTTTMALFLVAAAGDAFAQGPATTPPKETIEAMGKLKFLVGSWEGDAVFQAGPGGAEEVRQSEVVESRLDGVILLIEGYGKKKDHTQQIVHHAFAVVSYEAAAQQYRVVAYRGDGQSVVAAAKFLADGSFQWGFDAQGRSVRYTITDRSGEWYEMGEFSADGKTWTRFLEMQLKRKS